MNLKLALFELAETQAFLAGREFSWKRQSGLAGICINEKYNWYSGAAAAICDHLSPKPA
jgi:hypothetical protein